MRALILVDIQNDFLPGGPLGVAEGDQVASVANRLMGEYDLVVATQDFHPADHLSFASQHPGKQPGDVIELGGLPQVLWPDHCMEDTTGAEFDSTLDTARIARVFTKGTNRTVDSYSGFFDNGRQHATGLGEYLKENGITAVSILGLATDYCVKFTALDAIELGFQTELILDGCRGVDLTPGDVQRAVEAMQAAGVKIRD
ncbi:MAG: bifunctional nicotinamidase/pyrazinamidase [Planctomycetia bacterium]|jgi:nicotinamidase/pyrazinamidase